MRPPPSAQTASICGSCLGSSEPESVAMLLVCQSIRSPSLCDRENQAIFATRSPTATRDIRPFRLRRKQIPETSRSGTWTTRRTRSRLFFDLPFLAMGEGLSAAIAYRDIWKDRLCYARGKIELEPSPMSALGQKQTYAVHSTMSALHPIATSIAFFSVSASGQKRRWSPIRSPRRRVAETPQKLSVQVPERFYD